MDLLVEVQVRQDPLSDDTGDLITAFESSIAGLCDASSKNGEHYADSSHLQDSATRLLRALNSDIGTKDQ